MDTFWIALIAFALSFAFAIGGVGSAVILVIFLHWIGFPLHESKATGLFVNTASLLSGSIVNIKHRRLDFTLGILLLVSAAFMAPIGAYISTLMPEKTIIIIFVLFFLFFGNMMLFFDNSKYKDRYRQDRPLLIIFSIGGLAGMFSGLLGVGAGGVVAPLMSMLGFNPKKIAAITAFVVPFSSLTGFIAYWYMGHINTDLLLPVGVGGCMGGYLGTNFMQTRLSPVMVKRFIALVFIGVGIGMVFRFIY